MKYITFKDILAVHGRQRALKLLLTIETLAQIQNKIASIDLDARFENAFKTLCNIRF